MRSEGCAMCGRYCLVEKPADVGAFFDALVRSSWPLRFNIAPTQKVPVLRRMFQLNGTPKREIGSMHWGLIPSWAKDRSIGNRMINARSETAAEKPAFRTAWKTRRCAVPASGFYEWQKGEHGKVPHFIRRADHTPMALAGLWETWRSEDGSELESVTILTTTPNRFMKPIHDRMPVIIEPNKLTAWLDDGDEGTDLGVIAKLARPAAAGVLEAFPVSRRVNNPRNDDAGCLEAVSK